MLIQLKQDNWQCINLLLYTKLNLVLTSDGLALKLLTMYLKNLERSNVLQLTCFSDGLFYGHSNVRC